jgi:hypothetical protein
VTDDERKALATRIGESGSVEPIGGESDLTLVKVADTAADAREAWQQVHEAVGGKDIQPVMLDPNGKPQYPTGEVSVRFRTTLHDSELRDFAKRHGLRFLRRNEFVPEQAVFEPVEKNQYLPDIIEAVSAATETRLVWANTLSAYERS